jgi:hypothetical protein
MFYAAQLLADPSTEESYKGLLISGAITIVVAFIGAWATRAVKRRDATTSAPPPENEPQWLKDLRGENRRLRREQEEDERKIRTYERYLLIAGIDPETGRRLSGEQSGQGTATHPHPTPNQQGQ